MRVRGVGMVLWVLALSAASGRAAGIAGDAEAATHGDEASTYRVVRETSVDEPGFILRQYNLAVLSHYSYLVGSGGEAMIVDPGRDIERYLKDAADLKLKITRIYLTHSHADFVAGHAELAAKTGAPVLVNQATGALYKHEPVADKTSFGFGDVRCVVMTTPGHTPDGTCLAVHAPAASAAPRLVFTGDTLFIGSIGRPDLLGGQVYASDLASMAYDSWHAKLSKMPDAALIFPAHGAGSLCGAHLSDKPVSTFGEQKVENPYLRHQDRATFVAAVLEGLPEAPQYFGHNAKMNHDGPALVDWAKQLPAALAPADVQRLAAGGAWLVDTRDADEFAAGHVAGAINIGLRGRFETWVGIMVPWGVPFVLLGSDDCVREAAFRLHRIGYDSPAGYLAGGQAAWQRAGLPVRTVQLVQPAQLREQLQSGKAPVLVDVRLPAEWMGLRISEVMLNIPINKLGVDHAKLNPELPVMTVCNSAYRSSMGASVLLKAGFKDVRNLAGGSEAWIQAGFPTFGSAAAHGAAPAGGGKAPGMYVNLPEPIAPADLAARLMDLPGSVDVLDLRPAWQFAEFSIGGSVNASVQDAMNNPAYLNDKRPLILACRDGSVSAAVAGALCQKSARPIRFLSGGVSRYFDEVARPKGIRSEALSLPAAPAAPAVTPAPAPAPAAPTPAPAPKKKSAGC